MIKIVEDYQEGGEWVRERGQKDYRIITRSARIWLGISSRCNVAGACQKRQPTYIGCRMSENFRDFQYFTNWCQTQVGYGVEEYELDKDILYKGNKEYGENFCVFIPREINLCFIKRESKRGTWPIGVHLLKHGKFRAVCNNGQKQQKHLGCFSNPIDAFNSYKSFKEVYIKQLAEKYKTKIDCRVYTALNNYQVEITD